MRSKLFGSFFLGLFVLGMVGMASATVIGTGEISPGDNGTFLASASLISDAAPAFTGGASPLYTENGWDDWPQMTDGYVGSAIENQAFMLLEGAVPIDPAWAVWQLDMNAQPDGYDIGSIEILAGFNQNRPWQNVEIKYALAGDMVIPGTELPYTLGSYAYQPEGLGSGYNATKLTIADDADWTMLSGVSAIQVKFLDNGFEAVAGKSNYTSYREISVLPAVEPSPIQATGTYTEDVTAPVIPDGNLILQGSDTLDSSYAGGSSPGIGGVHLPGEMNNGVLTDASATIPEGYPENRLDILVWDGVTEDFGWEVYKLDTSINTDGYDISEILSYSAWKDARVNQALEIKYALVGDTITEGEELGRTLGEFRYAPSNNSDTQTLHYATMSITNTEDPLILSGVSAIEVKYIDNGFNGAAGVINNFGNYTAYKQFVVIGTPTVSNIPGDANKDGKVDGSDVTILAGNWQYGVTGGGATWGMGDFNGDGKVDGSDVTILAGNWQYGVTVAATSVPEPSTFVGLLGLCVAGLLPLVRRRKL